MGTFIYGQTGSFNPFNLPHTVEAHGISGLLLCLAIYTLIAVTTAILIIALIGLLLRGVKWCLKMSEESSMEAGSKDKVDLELEGHHL